MCDESNSKLTTSRWKRIISRQNIKTFSELMSALTLFVGAIIYFYSAYEARQLSVNASFLISRPKGASFFVSNDGGVDVAIKSITITSEMINRTYPVRLKQSSLAIPRGTSKVIESEPSDLSDVVTFEPTPNRPDIDKNTAKTRCIASFVFITAKSETLKKDVPATCIAACVFSE